VHNRSDTTPVFCDQSGVRSVVLQWGGRGIGLLLLLLGVGLALTLQTRIEVPGLSQLLPTIDGSSELFDGPARRSGSDRQFVRQGNVIVPNTSNEPVARVRDLPIRRLISAAPTVEPGAEHPTVTRVQPTITTPTTTPSAAPTAQSSPTGEPSPTAGPTPSPTTQRNPNAAVARESPNAQGSAARAQAPGQAKAGSNGNGGNAPSPKAGVEPTNP
jgi:hypothetical protein